MRYHFTLTRMAVIKKIESDKSLPGYGKIRTLVIAGEMENGTICLENGLTVPQKIKRSYQQF